ncbi:MAG: acyl dehydratase [Gammaproteobacteria bacterium]|nr:acyl dehydratase [Gammaproteobacteria bacterium]
MKVDGPYFEDFHRGLEFDAPAVTVTAGHAAIHQALFGDRLRLPLDHGISARITGSSTPLCHPLIAINIAIGQSTWASQRVKANLFYRGLVLRQPVFLGDTLYTRTCVAGLRQNKARAGRATTGIVALEITTTNQRDETVLRFWRYPMIPYRETNTVTGHADDLDTIGQSTSLNEIAAAVQSSWNVAPASVWRGVRASEIPIGERYVLEARDSITSAPELVRLSLNMAIAHTDSRLSYLGERLVYGGHTIFMGFAQITRGLPNLLTVLAWESCDHLAPVLEGDRVRTEFIVTDVKPSALRGAYLLRIMAECFAARGNPEEEVRVLDWKFWALSM